MSEIVHGIDLVEISRIRNMLEKHGEHFLKRVYTEAEVKIAGDNKKTAEKLAGRFAAKEAIFKLVGTGLRGKMNWTDIEVLPDHLGKPNVSLSGHTAEKAASLGISEIAISITHTSELAMASVMAICNKT